MAAIDHMNGGNEKTSYANNSLFQKKVISMTSPIMEEAITDIYSATFPETLCIADLGCSYGPNAFLVFSQLIRAIEKVRVKFGREKLPEFQVYFNDLPQNDFNSIFRLLPEFQESLKKQYGPHFGHCFFGGVPRSFYERLFPANSVHFIHSSYSVHWLSKVPDMVETNKGNTYLSATTPASIVKAFYEQFEKDFSMLLENRAKEIVPKGFMVLTFVGRASDNVFSKETCYLWELLAKALNQMVMEGLIEEEKLDSFNIPHYGASPKEVRHLIEKQGSFIIDRLEVSKVYWTGYDAEIDPTNDFPNGGQHMANTMRAVVESMLVNHFGDAIMDEVFIRYSRILDDCMGKEKNNHNVNVTVSMTKKMSFDD